MANQKQFIVSDLRTLEWAASLTPPTKRFYLFVAADTSQEPVGRISDFAIAALSTGVVYLCAWGNGCERFHDIVDECIADADLELRKFVRPNDKDVVMTTWHSQETLEDALDFFASCAVPTNGFAEDSDFRIVACVGHPEWAFSAKEWLVSMGYFI